MKYVFLVLWLVFTAGAAYAGWRGWQAWHPWSWARTTWVALVGLLYASLLAALALGRGGASEAARVMAMQSANDNAKELLDDLQLEYNKLRQQSITSELLDIAGGQGAQD